MASQVERPAVPLFALIIGIDDYANGRKLGGAVADAKSVKQYLQEDLHVAEDRISTLFDDRATRDRIIRAFRDLRDDKRIDYGDPIVIFYSGHGKEIPAPPAWGLDSKIQSLLPQDCGVTGAQPIPDRTIGALIQDIAEEKGDNITVIFDCCYSGSGTRENEYVPRTVDIEFNILENLDDNIWGSRDGAIANGFAYHGLWSHVLLAACREKELAYENKGRGEFTAALLAKLKSCAVNDLTYAELLGQIQLKMQHPQCEGFNQNRVLFNGKVPADREVYYPVRVRIGGKYVIGAGLAHGVSRGAEFTLYNDRKVKLGVVPVNQTSSVEDFKTTVKTSLRAIGVSFAKLTGVGTLPVYVDPKENFPSALQTPDMYGRNAPKIRHVGAEEAKLRIAMENDGVAFGILDERVKSFGLTKLPYKATLDSVPRVLSSAAHYFWFLGLAKEHDCTKSDVAIDFYRLKIDYDDYGDPLLSPVEPGFCQKDPNVDEPDVIDFVVDPDAYYGIKITNKTPWNLYLNVFMFNNSSLSIVPYYIQSSAGEPEAPLKQGGTFTIGYGPGGTSPFNYSLQKSQDVDVGYLKIFFATRPIDLSDIKQPSPFVNLDERAGSGNDAHKLGSGRFGTLSKALAKWLSLGRDSRTDRWFTLDIPVVQRRHVAA